MMLNVWRLPKLTISCGGYGQLGLFCWLQKSIFFLLNLNIALVLTLFVYYPSTAIFPNHSNSIISAKL